MVKLQIFRRYQFKKWKWI